MASRWLLAALCWASPLAATAQESPAWMDSVLAAEDWRQAFPAQGLEATFEAVAHGIRYEPYPGVMRGPRGTAVAAAGNAWDQSLLLARLLSDRGYRVRFARGPLSEQNRLILLRGLYPPALPGSGFGFEFTPYTLEGDAALNAAVTDHLWVEVAQGDTWLPLDPAFPRASVGSAYVEATAHFDAMPEQAFTRLGIRLRQTTASGETRDLFTTADTVERLALRPLWLTITTSPLMPAEKKRRAASLTFSAPSDTAEPDTPPQPKGSNHHWAWGQGRFATHRGTVTVLDEQPETHIQRQWLEFVIDFADGRQRVVSRDLPPRTGPDATGFRRYQLLIAPGRVPQEYVEGIERRVSSGVDLEQLQQQLSAANDASQPDAARALEQSAGTLAHFLLGLRFAAESDALSDRIAWANGVALVHHQPRLLLTSTETGQAADAPVSSQVNIDLRLDEVMALPYPGFPQRAATLFQAARGMQESVLEGALLAELNQDNVSLSTARFMEQALAENIPLQVLNVPGEGAAGIPPPVRSRLDAALADGAHIVIPERPVEIDGRARWGWWRIDPASGALVGVMDNGLHAAMAEYSLDLSKIGLDDRMGLALGAIVGATSTHITIATLILKHGEYGPAMAEEVTRILKRITCLSCPEATASASAGAGASASVSIGGDCLSESTSVGMGVEVGVGIKVGSFCDAYVKGFKCASGLILNGLATKVSVSAGVTFDANLSFGCD